MWIPQPDRKRPANNVDYSQRTAPELSDDANDEEDDARTELLPKPSEWAMEWARAATKGIARDFPWLRDPEESERFAEGMARRLEASQDEQGRLRGRNVKPQAVEPQQEPADEPILTRAADDKFWEDARRNPKKYSNQKL